MSPKGRAAGRRACSGTGERAAQAGGAQAGDSVTHKKESSGRRGPEGRDSVTHPSRASGSFRKSNDKKQRSGRGGREGRDSVTHPSRASGSFRKSNDKRRHAGEATDAALRSLPAAAGMPAGAGSWPATAGKRATGAQATQFTRREASTTAEATVTLTNKYGLHMRPAGEVVKMANSFPCDIRLTAGGVEADAKSVLGLIALEAHRGDEVLIQAKGQGAREAVAELAELLASLPEFDDKAGVDN